MNARHLGAVMMTMIMLALSGAEARSDIVYVSPDGGDGYWRTEFGADPGCVGQPICRREAKGTLAQVLGDRSIVRRERTRPVDIRLLSRTSGDETTDYATEGDPLDIESEGRADRWLRIVGQTRGPFDGAEKVFTRIVGKSLKRTLCDRVPARQRAWCRKGEVAPDGLVADLSPDRPEGTAEETVKFDVVVADSRNLDLAGIRVAKLAAGHQSYRINCVAIRRSSFVALEGVSFRDCWLPAVYIEDSSHVRISRGRIEGSSYAIMAQATGLDPTRTRHLTVDRLHWLQSSWDYLPRVPGCEPYRDLDCPVDIWHELPWGVVHDRFWEMLNGGLFGGRDIQGDVDITDNRIDNAYNGVRLGHSPECRKRPSCFANTNRRIDVSRNHFEKIRDNPIEPETFAADWWITENDFVESHAWISTDDVAGGRIYVIGNTGTFIDGTPADRCEFGENGKKSPWAASPLFAVTKTAGGYCIPGVAGPCRDDEPDGFITDCQSIEEERAGLGRAARGKVLKVLLEPKSDRQSEEEWKDLLRSKSYLEHIYFIHNSWRLLKPIYGEGLPSPTSHWNNAIEFANCAADGDLACRAVPIVAPGCSHLQNYWSVSPDGRRQALFGSCTSFTDRTGRFEHRFDHDASNFDWPQVMEHHRQERAGIVIDDSQGRKLFADSANGDFLPSDPAMFSSACRIEWDREHPGHLVCGDPAPGTAIGAVQPDRDRFRLKRPW